jgi:hypothetical protein
MLLLMTQTTSSPLTSAEVQAFTYGDCWALAEAMSQQSDYPVVSVSGVERGWVHAGVLLPSGEVLDAEGVHDAQTWKQVWADKQQASLVPLFGGSFVLREWSVKDWSQAIDESGLYPVFALSLEVDKYAAELLSWAVEA